jgi:hypothetical protein
VHTDDRALKRDLGQQHADLERLAGRVHQFIDPPPIQVSRVPR